LQVEDAKEQITDVVGIVGVRADRRRDCRRRDRSTRLLKQGPLAIVEGHLACLAPKAYAHDADEECVVILKGRMEFWVGDEYYEAEEGDSLLFESRIPHRNRNPGPTKAEVMWIITPPSY
jgi:mannose-6-phosphate isomerase-like protein (cupin superfamily)